ncbi:MAG: phosphopentomutase [Planctomycetota bacterium]|jgi:phosphopentomutase
MRRVFLIVLDSLGVGAMPDAAEFGDEGAHTLDHLVEAGGGLDAPRLVELGLGNVPGVTAVPSVATPAASVGRLTERSVGKDTSTGHWEMGGIILSEAFPVFPDGFPQDFIDEFVARAELPGVLCNLPASGTEVIKRLGQEHLDSGMPIVYTSADSVFQIAAHQEHFGLERLYHICEIARELLKPKGVGRIIARPFIGEVGSFTRTYDRRDYSLEPPMDTSLDRLVKAGVPVVGVGKISDIFAGRGVSRDVHTEGNRDGMAATLREARSLERGLVFVNLVDFDMLYGHRRDPVGYARALEEFDRDLIELEKELRDEDIVILTADHGNDPTHVQNTDHTREYVPVIAFGPGAVRTAELGTRASFADIGATVEELLGLDASLCSAGASFAKDLGARELDHEGTARP